MPTNTMMREGEAAAYCRLAQQTLRLFRVKGTGPAYAKLGKSVVYSVRDVEAWIAARKVRSTSESVA